jgi:hypothetical protein
MANTWHIPKLENTLKEMENSKVHIERVKSVSRAIDIFQYHLHTAEEANDLIEPSNRREAMELVLAQKDKFFETKLEIQANTQASIHSARAIYDLFAQLINGLLLNTPLAVHKCDFFKIKDKLTNSELKGHLNHLSTTEEFLYVNAFVNTIKHRNLVSFGALIDFESGKSGVKFQSFQYSDKEYPAMWAEDVLKYSLFVKNAIITSGDHLNRELGVTKV